MYSNCHKIYQHFTFQGPPKYTQIWSFGMKIYHLAIKSCERADRKIHKSELRLSPKISFTKFVGFRLKSNWDSDCQLGAGWPDEFAKKYPKMLPKPIFCPNQRITIAMKKVAQQFWLPTYFVFKNCPK
jgi:hypothetical protein